MVKVSIIGASGYGGGELIRLLLGHPEIELDQLVSRSFAGKSLWKAHPNLRNVPMRFSDLNVEKLDSDLVFVSVPHKASMSVTPQILEKSMKVIDLSADFRLHSKEVYEKWYGVEHTAPDLLEKAVYGIPEIHGEEIKNASLVACAGCEATSSILALAPLKGKARKVLVDAKIGGCAAGRNAKESTHYPERANTVRPYAPDKHRHAAEVEQELGFDVMMSAHAVTMVRGILTTNHILEIDSSSNVVQTYREFYKDSPFVRITPSTSQFLPNPKYVLGSNYCDVGVVHDDENNRLVAFSALDNMMKGAAGQAVQCMNLMFGFDETLGISMQPIYPI